MDMIKNKYVTMHMDELHDTKFHNRANLKILAIIQFYY
jgi:hypothetical protein